MNGVITILNAGTSYNRDEGDIVAELAKTHLEPTEEISLFSTKDEVKKGIISGATTQQVTEKKFFGLSSKTRTEVTSAKRGHGTWLINAGPGGGKVGVDMPGSIEPITGEKKFIKDKTDLFDFQQFEKYEKNLKRQTWAKIFGKGMDHNVIRTVAIIDQLVSWSLFTPQGRDGKAAPTADRPSPLTKINLVGWSRGAVTCHMIAHALAEFEHQNKTVQSTIRNLPVTIFAFDPVPGGDPGGSPYNDISRMTIPSNVKRYTGIYCEHDTRKLFQPAIVDQDLNHQSIIMSGGHGTMVEAKQGYGEVAEIATALCHRFLVDEGTHLLNPIFLTDIEILERYAKIILDMEWYKKQKGSYITSGGRMNRDFSKLNTTHNQFFVNTHHETLFKKEFPQYYTLLFGPKNTPMLDFQKMAFKMKAPQTVERLRESGFIS